MSTKEHHFLLLKMIPIILVLGFVLGISSILIINSYVKRSSSSRIISEEEASKLGADCILVLGAGIWSGNRPSPMLEDRLNQGIQLYKLGASDKLLMSGDHGRKDYDEVNVMKNFAKDLGVPSEDIFMDHAGFSTYESMYRAKEIFEAKKVIIVTQKYHLYRALYLAKSFGIDAWGVNSDPRQYAGQSRRDFREVLARCKDFVYCITKPKPTYLGDPIPVSGNGDVTNDK